MAPDRRPPLHQLHHDHDLLNAVGLNPLDDNTHTSCHRTACRVVLAVDGLLNGADLSPALISCRTSHAPASSRCQTRLPLCLVSYNLCFCSCLLSNSSASCACRRRRHSVTFSSFFRVLLVISGSQLCVTGVSPALLVLLHVPPLPAGCCLSSLLVLHVAL